MPLIEPPPEALAAILGPDSTITRRVEIFESDGITPWLPNPNPAPTGGSVNVDMSRQERRTFDLTLDNTDGSLRHYPGGFWYDKVIKIHRGVQFIQNRTPVVWDVQIGEFVIDTISETNFPNVVSVSGRDYSKNLLTDKFTRATAFAQGQSVELVIRAIAQNAGITKFVMPNKPTKTTGKVFTFERGVERLAAIDEIAQAYGYECFFNGQGYLVIQEYRDPVTSPVTWRFETGLPLGNLVDFTKVTNDSRIYNSIVVTGESADQTTLVYSIAQNHEPSSPTRIRQVGVPGGLSERLYQYTSAFITKQSQADEVARNMLRIHALEEFNVDLQSIVFPWLEAGEIVEFIDPNPAPGDPTRFLLSSFSIPIGLGSMGLNAKRVTLVG